MQLRRGNKPLQLAYVEDNLQDAEALLDSWRSLRPVIENPLIHYPSVEALLHAMQAPFSRWPDIVLMDLCLGEGNLHGSDGVKLLRAQPELAQQSIVLLTGSDEQTAAQIARLTGAHGWCGKPVRAPQVLTTIGGIVCPDGKTDPRYRIEIVDRWMPEGLGLQPQEG